MTFKFAPIKATQGYRRAAEAIEQEIISGRLAPGEMLPTEFELAAQLGVNRSTLREAIRLLENMGLVRRGAGKRLVASIPSSGDISRATARALSLGRSTFLDLWEVQMVLEPFAAGLAAERAPSDVIDALKENVLQTEKNLADDATIIRLDVEFHQLIAQATLNLPLVLSMHPIGDLLLSATQNLYQRAPRARSRLLEAHQKILDAISNGDANEATLWMRRHIRDFCEGYRVAGLSLETTVSLSQA